MLLLPHQGASLPVGHVTFDPHSIQKMNLSNVHFKLV